MVELLWERWGHWLDEAEELSIEGSQVGDRLFLTFSLEHPIREEELTLELQLLLTEHPDPEIARHLAYDALDTMLGQYLEEERSVFFPTEWVQGEFLGRELAYRGSFRRAALERQADQLLNRQDREP